MDVPKYLWEPQWNKMTLEQEQADCTHLHDKGVAHGAKIAELAIQKFPDDLGEDNHDALFDVLKQSFETARSVYASAGVPRSAETFEGAAFIAAANTFHRYTELPSSLEFVFQNSFA